MNFELTEEQQMLKDMVREFAEKEIMPQAKTLETNHEFPAELITKLAELGIMGTTVPSEFDGIKTDNLSFVLLIEELSRAMPALAVIVSVHSSLFCYPILKFGSNELKEKYLSRAARGEILGAFSLTEPGAGSDVSGIKTKAIRKGDHFILNGTKAWVTGGGNADAVLVVARSELKGKKQLNAFIIEKDFPGFNVSKVEDKMGLNASRTVELVLENCQVPAENLLGEEGDGIKIALHCLDGSRIGIAAQSIGLGQRALEEAIKYAKQREAFGKTISDFQAIQFMLADIGTQLDAGRYLTYRAADLYDRGKPFTKEAAMAKLFASEAANRIVYKSLQIHGGYGYSKEFVIEQLYRDARVLSIYEGTSEIQRMVIARELLKDD